MLPISPFLFELCLFFLFLCPFCLFCLFFSSIFTSNEIKKKKNKEDGLDEKGGFADVLRTTLPEDEDGLTKPPEVYERNA